MNLTSLSNLKHLLFVAYCLLIVRLDAQKDSVYHIALILPFQSESTIENLDDYSSARDFQTASKIQFNEDAIIAMEFYQGVLQSLNDAKDSIKIEVSLYDCWNNDSVTTEILKNEKLKKVDIIIGPVATSNAKAVADFCKQNKIINIQPFTPSKSLTSENPYHLKLAPTIDSHIDAMFNSIVDSFPGCNIILYTPDNEKGLAAAKRFDSLFRDYNRTTSSKFTVELLNTKDMMLDGVKTTAAEQLKTGKHNIIIITSFEESFVNGNLRVLFNERMKNSIIVYGMPTWMSGDILRLDYLNDYSARISDGFFVDSSKAETRSFLLNYETSFSNVPSRFSFLGYDVMNFTIRALHEYGKDFLNKVYTQRFSGTAYKFDIVKAMENKSVVNYFENNHVNIFKVQDYQLKKAW